MISGNEKKKKNTIKRVKANFVPDEIPSLSPGDENYEWYIIDAIESMHHLRQQMT